MKDSLEHLPEGKREELRRLTETIRGMCDDVEHLHWRPVRREVPDLGGRLALLRRAV
jgi:hypothetical protein